MGLEFIEADVESLEATLLDGQRASIATATAIARVIALDQARAAA